MKKTDSSLKAALIPLKQKFKEAGCECNLKAEKNFTTLKITYATIVAMPQRNRSAG